MLIFFYQQWDEPIKGVEMVWILLDASQNLGNKWEYIANHGIIDDSR